ncbi:MAG: hypothetical protein KGJ86_15775 [Chloroflexota bacterium]|nr:hypothetical protein [Chloroflexota bacterium]
MPKLTDQLTPGLDEVRDSMNGLRAQTRARPLAYRTTMSLAQLGCYLSFEPRVLGRSLAPVVYQSRGAWRLVPQHLVSRQPLVLHPDGDLPSRARSRLQELLDTSLEPRAIVVFHEALEPTPSRAAMIAAKTHRWLSQELPRMAQESSAKILKRLENYGPLIVRGAEQTAELAGVLAIGAGAVALGAIFAAAAAVGDPCLVVVTRDHDWLEVDRWY